MYFLSEKVFLLIPSAVESRESLLWIEPTNGNYEVHQIEVNFRLGKNLKSLQSLLF